MAKKEKKKSDLPKPIVKKSEKQSQRKSPTKCLEEQPNFGQTLAVNLSFEELISLSVSLNKEADKMIKESKKKK